jgi:hypothetical protein
MTMIRSKTWPVAAVGLAAAILAVVGCRGGRTADPSASGGETRPAGGAPAAKLLADWPRPAAALIVTGEQLGYLAPCGCTQGQKGGLIRREILIERLREQGWPLALVDLGSLINNPTEHGGEAETKIRYTIALKALEMLKYDALAFSASDLRIGVDEVAGQIGNLGDRPKVVAANVTPAEGLLPAGKFVPSVRVAAGPVTVGITAVVDPETFKPLKDPSVQNFVIKPPESVLPAALAELEKDTGVQVLMFQGPPETARRLVREVPGFEVVVCNSPFVDPPKDEELLNDGKTRLIMVGQKGQCVGVVGIYPDAEPKFRYARVELVERYDKEPALAKLGEPMRKLLDDTFPSYLKLANVLQEYPRRPYTFNGIPAASSYVGAEACKPCHAESYRIWAKTPHAKAYRGLTDPKRNREWDAECVSCHTTGFEYVGGYTTPEATPQLKNNQCENCHGPGSLHAGDPDNKEFRKAVARSKDDWERNHRCLQCHDEDNDNHFDFAADWPKIEHTAVDDYSDPKVHRAAAPKAP